MSQTLDTRYLRNKDIIDQSQLQSVTVIGSGGIGSAIVQSLAIMGFKEIILYDNDTYNVHILVIQTKCILCKYSYKVIIFR